MQPNTIPTPDPTPIPAAPPAATPGYTATTTPVLNPDNSIVTAAAVATDAVSQADPESLVPPTSWSKIVIVEDNAALADIYKIRLDSIGYTCYVAYDGIEALALIQKERPSLVLLDLMVPKIAGDQILATMRANPWGKDIKVLIISNLNEADAPAGLREQGIEGYAVKANLSNDQLDQLVDNILKPAGQSEDVSLESPDTTALA